MHLIMFRVIGHPAVPDSAWIEIGRGLNVLDTDSADRARALARMVQTINPPYPIDRIDPFGPLPRYLEGPGYRRRIIPAKKTAALAIFAASPLLVRELTTIDSVYYATDRVEFGRRRDYSRWVNFVELAGSARWSEIEPTLGLLFDRAGAAGAGLRQRLEPAIAPLRGSDRIKGPIAATLKEHLEALWPYLPGEDQERLDQCLTTIARADHFRQAKDRASAWLPYFVLITAATVDLAAAGRAVAPVEAAATVPLAFLAECLAAIDADRDAREQRQARVNRQLEDLYPGLILHFDPAGGAVTLESRQRPAPLSLPQLPPVRRIEALLAAVSALHGQLHGHQPVFLVDISDMGLAPAERIDLLQVLLRHCSRWQSVVVPDRDFLELCRQRLGPGGRNGHALARLIEA